MKTPYQCKHCGISFPSIHALTASNCGRHPSGTNKGKHALYEGTPKTQYICKYCGLKFPSLYALTAQKCHRHPIEQGKLQHEAAL